MSNGAYAWSNGGYSAGINNPKYGTHDFILEKAINMLPSEMKNKINITIAYYGTEIPDCKSGPYCIGDTTEHHVYYYKNGSVQHDNASKNAQKEYDLAKSYLQLGDKYNFSLHLGAMSHYIDDVAVFGHTMGTNTDWGKEIHHNDYESYVNNNPKSFSDISFDGTFDNVTAYNSTLELAKDTTFDEGIYTNTWMDKNYNWSNKNYVLRTNNLINHAANNVADVIYNLLSSSNIVNRIKGDINDDKQITSSDALLYLKYVIGRDISPYHIDNNDDVTCDNIITVADALKVLKKAVGQDVNLICI